MSAAPLGRRDVVVELNGGLGNQLFEYAAARALADGRGGRLFTDMRRLNTVGARGLALQPLCVRIEGVAPGCEGRQPTPHQLLPGVRRVLARRDARRVSSTPPGTVELQGLTVSDPHEVDEPVWMRGYFQDRRFFAAHEPAIRSDLTWRSVPPHLPPRSATDVAVHVRRGDYLHAKNADRHPVAPLDYYERAMARMRTEVTGTTFTVFSDDLAWVSAHLAGDDVRHASGPADSMHSDLYSMTRYRRHIIANSSFSWWGAFLAAGDRVIAPVVWFGGDGEEGSSLIPALWLRM